MEKFKPFDKVLVKEGGNENSVWEASHYYQVIKENYMYCQIIPFEGNEHLYKTSRPYSQPRDLEDGSFIKLMYKDHHTIGIFKNFKMDGHKKLIRLYCAWSSNDVLESSEDCWDLTYVTDIVPATNYEKYELLNKLNEDTGQWWDSDINKLVTYLWRPKKGEEYYIPMECDGEFYPYSFRDFPNDGMYKYYEKGWVFDIKEKCQEFCDKLNKAINNVK